MPHRKRYLLVSSDDKVPDPLSTSTDFNCLLEVPIDNVVKTDLVSVSADYRIANITAPNNTFSFAYYNFTTNVAQTRTITLPEGLYNPAELLDEMVALMNDELDNNSAQSTLTGVLLANIIRMDLLFPQNTNNATERTFTISTTSTIMRTILGMTLSSRSGTYTASLGSHGGSRLTMPRAVTLTGLSPYIMIQSGALGNDTMTTKGISFWRALINDATNPTLQIANNREDEYFSPHPFRLYNIDCRVVYPNGTLVDNRGGVFAFIVEVIVETDDSEKFKDEPPQIQEVQLESIPPHTHEPAPAPQPTEEEKRLIEAHHVAREEVSEQEDESGVFEIPKIFPDE